MSSKMQNATDHTMDTARIVLTIDLNALRTNYRSLKAMQAPGDCAAVVKANAYGLGLGPVADVLWDEGCRTFFVATLDEAHELRKYLSDATIYILDGLFRNSAANLAADNLRPVLGSIQEIEEWAAVCVEAGRKLPCAIHLDTGMNRLGLEPSEVSNLAARPDLLIQIDFALVMTHLVSGEVRNDPLTLHQAELFDRLRALLPDAPTSFGNSAGTQLCGTEARPSFCYDLARPGVALYGAHIFVDAPNPMQPVVTLQARVLKLRDIQTGDTIGYNATWRADRPMRVATLGIGYADGIFRSLSTTRDNPGLSVYFGDRPAPLLGRVSMDYIGVNVSDLVDEPVKRGDWAELIGPHVSIDDMAKHAGTNAYEILISLSTRAQRIYLGHNQQS